MRFTALLFVAFLLLWSWGHNHAWRSQDPLPMAATERCEMPRNAAVGGGLVRLPADSSQRPAGRDVSNLPVSPGPVPADAPAPVPEGTRWVFDTRVELETRDDSQTVTAVY